MTSNLGRRPFGAQAFSSYNCAIVDMTEWFAMAMSYDKALTSGVCRVLHTVSGCP
ncbi:hypothetical protein BD311DRAFT_762298 [Dichomitus squalens]|uniref:Uncharacterized protein n=1 Tax=Dichomitus squalens TaxID=114155 RepID=A0A4Q9MGH9_9APHY|nr:hypothetical protein BD311DRAFT_762298 [Dichomitus squalens]